MPWHAPALLLARVLLAALFLAGAAQKALSPAIVEGLLAARGLPAVLVWPAALFDLVAGLLLLAGVATTPTALLLALYSAVTSLFHFIPTDGWQMSIFVKNWAIAGGCLALAVAGPGAWSLRPRRASHATPDAVTPP